MESEKVYKVLFYAGSAWNFAIAGGLFVMTPTLHTLVGIAAPLYPMFIYFNLMSIFFFGCMQWSVAHNLWNSRVLVKLLMWGKFITVALFVYSILISAPPTELVMFLLPGMIIDGVFGLIFWRFLSYSRALGTIPAAVIPVTGIHT
ncbi:MAG: hypothetical protein L0Y80_11170 [Ignavibacteriae bacterium]|nr:hypothetical protein [Ignavibacteriota bacterium]